MATKIGPKTVTQRDRSKALVFCIDAAHSDSYGGQPFTQTVNALPEDATVGAATWTNTDFGHGLVGGIWHQETTGNVLYRGLVSSTIAPSNSLVITFSCYVWIDVAPGNYIKSAIALDIDGVTNYLQANGSWSTVVHEYSELLSPTKQGEWHRISTTITFPSSGTLAALNWGNFYRNAADFNLRIANLQIESGSTATRYSSTSRTAANAVTNISGVGAQGTTLTGTFATYGQQLHKAFPVGDASTGDISQPRVRNVNATVDPNQGHIGGAYWDFDGTDEYIAVGTTDWGIVAEWTVSWWMKMDSDGLQCFFSMKESGSNNKIEFLTNNTIREIFANLRDHDGTVIQVDTDNTVWSTGEWTHVAITNNGGTATSSAISFYINGEAKSNNVVNGSTITPMEAGSRTLNIGREESGSRYVDGKMAIVHMYSRALTAAEIQQNYRAHKGRFGK